VRRIPVDEAFDPLAEAYLADPYACFARVRPGTPVFYAPSIGMWVVTRYHDIDAIFRDPPRFSAANAQEPLSPLSDEARAVLAGGFGASPTMSNCDPPKHGRIRAHNNAAFSPRRIAVMEPQVRAKADELVTAMAAAPAGRADLVADLAFPLPAHTIFRFIGFPDGDTEMLKGWCTDRLHVTWGRPAAGVQVSVAQHMVAYWQYCSRFVADRLAAPADDFTSDLLRIHLADPEAISVDEITNIAYGLSFAGHETTTNLIANTVRRLLEHPDQWGLLVEDPGRIPGAVEEALRFDTSVVAWRRVTTEAVEIGGVPVPAGAKLLLLLGSANHDPAEFPEPERFDVTRANARNHLAFGKGIHFCLGAALARLQGRIVLELLTSRLPALRLVPGQHYTFPANVSFRGPQRLEVTWPQA
jgi:cytochrome P450